MVYESPEQRERFEKAAREAGFATLSGWVRVVLTAEARKILGGSK